MYYSKTLPHNDTSNYEKYIIFSSPQSPAIFMAPHLNFVGGTIIIQYPLAMRPRWQIRVSCGRNGRRHFVEARAYAKWPHRYRGF